ncbi:MAG TPA: hypothetical protein PLT82_13255, partial [Candidatus Hydrogenedens sp.]|nr:hypothetical protein [Candidatus Hydrogenedens sp.]HPP60090.1 hypothetical protein [Candidatus Hydrogenedens sp.]
ACVRETVPRVRIPLSPPLIKPHQNFTFIDLPFDKISLSQLKHTLIIKIIRTLKDTFYENSIEWMDGLWFSG